MPGGGSGSDDNDDSSGDDVIHLDLTAPRRPLPGMFPMGPVGLGAGAAAMPMHGMAAEDVLFMMPGGCGGRGAARARVAREGGWGRGDAVGAAAPTGSTGNVASI